MSNCEIKRIKKTKLCTDDLPYLVDIQTRALGVTTVGLSNPVMTLTTVRQQWCGIETVRGVGQGVARFSKVNILDGATHIFWCDWDSAFPDVENRNHFIKHDSKYYKVLKVDNVNERNETIAIQTTERGETSEEASEA